MKKILFFIGVILLAFILIVGISHAESGQPTATSWFWRSDSGEWYKAQADELGNLKISTNTIFAVSDPVIQAKLDAQFTLISTNTATIFAEMIKHYVLISTSGDTTVTRLDTINTELIKHYVLISTGGDITVARLDTINTELIKHYVLSSSNTATILTELIAEYVLMSTGTDTAIARLDTINTELIKHYVLISTAGDTTVARLDTIDSELRSGVTMYVMAYVNGAWVPWPVESGALGNPKFNLAKATNSVNIATMATDTVGPGTFALAVRSFNYGWNATDGEFVRERVDRILNVKKTIPVIHSEVHDGHMYINSYVWEALADDATAVFLIDTSTKNVHMVFSVTTSGDAQVRLYEGAVVTTSGTALTERNYNRVFPDTPEANIYRDPTQCNPTTELFPTFVGGGAGVGASTTASGGAIRPDTEWIFKKNELYVISVENESGGAAFVSITIGWYEEEGD